MLELQVQQIYGVPGLKSNNLPPKELLKCATIFPSAKDASNLVKGGVVVIKLKEVQPFSTTMMHINTSFEDFTGAKQQLQSQLVISTQHAILPYYQHAGVHKALVCYDYYVTLLNQIRSMNWNFEISAKQQQTLKKLHDHMVASMQVLNDASMAELVNDIVALMNAPLKDAMEI